MLTIITPLYKAFILNIHILFIVNSKILDMQIDYLYFSYILLCLTKRYLWYWHFLILMINMR